MGMLLRRKRLQKEQEAVKAPAPVKAEKTEKAGKKPAKAKEKV